MLVFSLLCQQLLEHLGGVGHDAVELVLHVSILLVIAVVSMFVRFVALCLYTIVGVVGCLFVGLFSIVGAFLAIVAAHTACLCCAVGGTCQGTLLLHLLIRLAYSTYLGNVDTSLHQLGDYLRIGCACAMLLGYKTHHLIIRHARLCHRRTRRQQHERKNDIFFYCHRMLICDNYAINILFLLYNNSNSCYLLQRSMLFFLNIGVVQTKGRCSHSFSR